MNRAVPDADALHAAALDVLKSLTCYHKPYRAAFAYPTADRIALVPRPSCSSACPACRPISRRQRPNWRR
ncbi:MAG: hypothetical protein U5M50_16150 [Sphingobium sp.]|nr:hypothetical protein [Sphingobium sp.]